MTHQETDPMLHSFSFRNASGDFDAVIRAGRLTYTGATRSIELDPSQDSLLTFLTDPLGIPVLPGHIKRAVPEIEKSSSVASEVDSLMMTLQETPLADNFLVIEKERAWRSRRVAFLPDTDPYAIKQLAKRQLALIDAPPRTGSKVDYWRRKQPFLALLKVVEEGEESESVSSHKLAWGVGAIVIGVTLGTATTLFVRSKRD